MRRLAMLWAALVVSALPVSGRADTRADFQVWNALLSTAKLSDDAPDLRLWLDVHLRRGENINTVIARPALTDRRHPLHIRAGRPATWFTRYHAS